MQNTITNGYKLPNNTATVTGTKCTKSSIFDGRKQHLRIVKGTKLWYPVLFRWIQAACDNHKRVGVCDSRPLFRWIQSIIILTGILNENPTEFGNRRLSDNADHLFNHKWNIICKTHRTRILFPCESYNSQSKWSDKSAAGAPDLTCIEFGKISKDLLWRSHYGGGRARSTS